MLNIIQKGKRSRPPRIFIYGTEGIGKSTFAAKSPSPIFIPTEDGLDQIECDKFPVATDYETVLSYVNALNTEEHNYSTIVIDSADWLERLVWNYLVKKYKSTSIEKVDGGFGRGYVYAVDVWKNLIDKLEEIRLSRNVGIIFTGHAKIENFVDPESVSFNRYSPRLNKLVDALLREWSDAVFFATREFGGERGTDGGNRIIKTVGSTGFVAKNRYNLPEVLPLDWEATIEKMKGL